jgi:hypothetical protein
MERRRPQAAGEGTCLLLVVLALVAACDRAGGDLAIRQRTSTTGLASRSSESTQYWSEKLMVVDEESSRVIVDFAAETMTTVNKQARTFFTLTFDEMRARMEAARQAMELRTADLPPDAREALERMGQPVGERASAVEVAPTGKKETIAGYEAVEYGFTGNAAHGSLWVSESLPLPLGEVEKGAFRKSMDGMQPPNMLLALAIAQTNAIPLRTVINVAIGPSGSTSTNEVIEVQRTRVPADVARVPQGFRQVDPPAPRPLS